MNDARCLYNLLMLHIETLPTQILTDMEESQIASLPPELAAEAQFLRRDWESRNGARMDAHPPSNALCKYPQ